MESFQQTGSFGSIIAQHDPCPPGLNPLLDLPAKIEDQDQKTQIEELVTLYNDDIVQGLGLSIVLTGRQESKAEARLAEKIIRDLGNADSDFLNDQFRAYLGREKHMVWAAQALSIPPEVVLGRCRLQAMNTFDYGSEPECLAKPDSIAEKLKTRDREFDLLLIEKHGICPVNVNPLNQLPAETERLSDKEKIDAMEQRFSSSVVSMSGIEDILAGYDSEAAAAVRAQVVDANELRILYKSCNRDEALLVWAATQLNIPPGEVLQIIVERALSDRQD